ncbi:MAG: ArsR family transcriptional regulator [Saprospiraceae bacterium]|nr:ArsR family transcriptional regulator [Saprospiraceae bacterium]
MLRMIDALISSKTRIKLLLKFFLNSNTTAYLRNLESEFGDSTNSIRLELNRLEEAGMLLSATDGNKKIFRANIRHPLFLEIHTILLKHIGLDRIVEDVIKRLGDIRQVYLIGEFSRGLDSPIIDLIFVGNIDKNYLLELVEKAEKLVKRKIRYLIYTPEEATAINWADYDPKPFQLWDGAPENRLLYP